ncbi:MAG: hypothetical protein ACI9IA_001423 [Enterobacterales bacterium]|jgi:hypothetical protein
MNLQSLANLSEIISGIAVVITLIYLALQIRQSTRAVQTENYARTLDRISTMQSSMSQNSDFALLQSRGMADISKLTTLEKTQFNWSMLEAFGAYEFMFHASETKDIPDEVWQRWSLVIALMMTLPGVQTWWEINPSPFTMSFTAYVESINSDNPTDMNAVQRYHDFLREKKVDTGS